jgi:dCTP diphosphatase
MESRPIRLAPSSIRLESGAIRFESRGIPYWQAGELAWTTGQIAMDVIGMPHTIEALTAEIRAFRDARDWMQFHAPKELAVAIAAEAGELLQHFVWQSTEQSEQRARERKEEIASEMADVAMLLFEMADNLGIDLGEAMQTKLARNEQRYPVAKARGSNAKYNEL